MALFTFTSSICVHDFNRMFTPTIRYEVEFILYFLQRANSGKVSVSTTALKQKITDIVTMESNKFIPTIHNFRPRRWRIQTPVVGVCIISIHYMFIQYFFELGLTQYQIGRNHAE